ncbi:MAG TPA: methylglyoxal synthase [Candidatus Dormibacteraeota bacterium]|nr:methylglyoxal synthase [Candidatus Dormibacteraeota bacterium]
MSRLAISAHDGKKPDLVAFAVFNPVGGDVQIANRVVEGNVDAVIFMVDPLGQHPHDPDIQTLLRICNVANVPLATNRATADALIGSPLLDASS